MSNSFLYSKYSADYTFDHAYDYATKIYGGTIHCDSVGKNEFRLLIQGEAVNPYIIIGDNEYQINGTVGEGETLLIDSMAKTITLTTASGSTVNWFDKRSRDSYIFEPIPPGDSDVLWNGLFRFDLTIIEKRSEPLWT